MDVRAKYCLCTYAFQKYLKFYKNLMIFLRRLVYVVHIPLVIT